MLVDFIVRKSASHAQIWGNPTDEIPQNKICIVYSNLYLNQLMDFKIGLDARLSGTMIYLLNKHCPKESWLGLREGIVELREMGRSWIK